MKRIYFKKSVWILLLTAVVLPFNNCSQLASSHEDAASTEADAMFDCSSGAAPVIDSVVRLTGIQYKNTIYDLLANALNATDMQNFWNDGATAALLGNFPTEGSYAKGNAMVYDTEDQRLSSPLLQAEIGLAQAAVQYLVINSSRLNTFLNHYAKTGSCASVYATTGAPQSCVDDFIKGFGLYVLHRPVETANSATDAGSSNPAAQNDLAFYEGVYGDATYGGFDALITTMMMSPDAVFLNPMKGSAVGNRVTLTNYEIATKFAYYFTDFPPDDALLSAAQSGFQGTGNSLTEQAQRLFKSPRARPRVLNFFKQWIRPDAIPALNAASNSPNTDLAQLRGNAIQEMLDLTEYYTFGKADGRLSDILTSDISFAKTADLAAIYNVPVWAGKKADGSYDDTLLVHFPSSDPRGGLFTRAGYAFSGARDNNPIIRGARIFKDYMCENVTPPAAFVLSPNVPMKSPPTIRHIVEANTEVPGSSCASCHSTYINPLGFPLELYDAFGRFRPMEPIYAADGTVTQTAAVDASSTPFAAEGDANPVQDGISFSRELSQNAEFNACFVRHWFRYSQGRQENSQADACRLNHMMTTLINPGPGGSLSSFFESIATGSDFQTRYINP